MVFEGLPPSPIWQRAGSFHHFCFELAHYIKSIISCIVFEGLPHSPIWQRAGSFPGDQQNIILHVFSSPLGLGVMPRDRECLWGDILTKLMACPIAQFGRGQADLLVTLSFTQLSFEHFLECWASCAENHTIAAVRKSGSSNLSSWINSVFPNKVALSLSKGLKVFVCSRVQFFPMWLYTVGLYDGESGLPLFSFSCGRSLEDRGHLDAWTLCPDVSTIILNNICQAVFALKWPSFPSGTAPVPCP